MKQPWIAIVGATGSGKTDAAIEIARSLRCTIVAVDSMQVYRDMNIGTGKPSQEIRRWFPHEGIDLVAPEQEFNVADYVRTVRPTIELAEKEGRVPLLVAGSGLYLQGLVDGLCEAPGRDPALRAELLELGRAGGAPALHARLAESDPAAAAKIHPNDLRRIVRALEVFLSTGLPISTWQSQTTVAEFEPPRIVMFGIDWPREKLYRSIEQRIDRWLAEGWVEEARDLSRRPLSRTSREALGYRELFSFLSGNAEWPATVELIKRNTRRYAKRQLSWFRRDKRVAWLPAGSPMSIAGEILRRAPVSN